MELPYLTGHGGPVARVLPRARGAEDVPNAEELVRIGKRTLARIAQEGECEPAVVAAARALVQIGREDLAAERGATAKTAAQMLEAIRRALPELERRAALEAGGAESGTAIVTEGEDDAGW